MEIRNNVSQPAFQANVDKALVKELKFEASRVSNVMLEKVESKINQVRTWGDEGSEISSAYYLEDNSNDLTLFNDKLSTSYGINLPQRGNNLLTSFFNLRKNDILQAEKEIEETVSNNKLDLVVKASMDDALAEKITGKILPSEEELTSAINKLSEQEITDFRFGLDKKPAETGKLLDFVL